MIPPTDDAAARDAAGDGNLPRLFLLIVLVEAATIAALYWFGRHFS